MKTAVSLTSIRSYDALRASGFKGQHAAIVSHMEPGRIYTRREISRLTGLETSAVAGRCNELVGEGTIVECGVVRCPISGKNVNGLKLAEKQLELLA